ncbi:YobA family protein [uncultured Paenibacillus sp.]|uniref:YobA family protein n=1 Tax=uncultured Paenibacillus sp. TaxID=227322 RepID=UPI0015A84B6D|nr:YobA family protein [uncultured Paenibacillus sp.]
MKRGWILFVMIMVCAGCASGPQSANFMEGEGYILEVAEDRVLVVEEPFANQGWTDIMEDYSGEAIWLRTRTPNLKPGQKIRYTIKGGIDESYPSQADAKVIQVLEE